MGVSDTGHEPAVLCSDLCIFSIVLPAGNAQTESQDKSPGLTPRAILEKFKTMQMRRPLNPEAPAGSTAGQCNVWRPHSIAHAGIKDGVFTPGADGNYKMREL